MMDLASVDIAHTSNSKLWGRASTSDSQDLNSFCEE